MDQLITATTGISVNTSSRTCL